MLRKHTLTACLAACFVFTAFSCSKKEKVIVSQECHPSQTVIRTANGETGVFGYSETAKLNIITVTAQDGTKSIYLICNPPATVPDVNATVTFSGAVRSSTISGGAGITYYELTLTSLG